MTPTPVPSGEPRRGRSRLWWVLVRRVIWWAVIIGLAVTAAWWLPRLQSADPATVSYSLVASHTTFEEPTPSPTPSTELPEIEGPESGSDFVFDQITEWVAAALADSLTSMANTVGQQTLNLRPESLEIMDPADPAGFHGLAFGVSRAAMLLLITIGALWIMTDQTLQTRVTLKEIAPRIVVGYVAMELSLRILSLVIVHTNACVNAILAVGFGGISADKIGETLREVAESTSEGESWMLVSLTLGLLVLVTLLLIGLVFRSLLLMLLAIIGPLALACHALPATEIVAKTWWKALAACVASALAQALVLVLWFRLFFDGETRRPNPLNMPEAIGQYADMLLIMALLWVMHKAVSIPMKKAFASTGGSPLGPIGQIARGMIMAKTFGFAGGITGGAAAGRVPGTATRAVRMPAGHRTTGGVPPPFDGDGGRAGNGSPPPAPPAAPGGGRRPGPVTGGPGPSPAPPRVPVPGPRGPGPHPTMRPESERPRSGSTLPSTSNGYPFTKAAAPGRRRPFLPPLPAHLLPYRHPSTDSSLEGGTGPIRPPAPRRREPRQW